MSKTFCTSLYFKYIVYFYLNTICLSLLGLWVSFYWKSMTRFQNKGGYVVGSVPNGAPREPGRRASSCSVFSGLKAASVARCLFSVHSEAWLPVSHRLSRHQTSDKGRSVNTTVPTHPPVTQIALKGRGRWQSVHATTDTRVLTALCKLRSDKILITVLHNSFWRVLFPVKCLFCCLLRFT